MTSGKISPIGQEALDSYECDPKLARATLHDIARANQLLGGRAAVAYGVKRLLNGTKPGQEFTLLDAGAGSGDIVAYLNRRTSRYGVRLNCITLDVHRESVRMCRDRGFRSFVADVGSIPLTDRCTDIIVVSQLLHHFTRAAAVGILRECARIARHGIVVADLERAHIATTGVWLASLLLRFHPTTRHDAVVSIRRGFSPSELKALLTAAGMDTQVYRRPGYRLVAAWRV